MSDLTDEEIIETRKLHGLDDDLFRENIEIGEYVRNKDGYIDKVKKIIEPNKDEYFEETYYICDVIMASSYKSDIVKHSKQLIDLIEVKDILKLKEGDEVSYIGLEKDTETFSYKDIKASIKKGKLELLEILTKEQFTANCYKVGGEDE